MESYVVDESFVAENMKSDLTLIVETHKIRVCKAVLCVASPVFRAMLMGDFEEKQLEEIEMPGKRYQNVILFLRCIYPDKLEYVTAETAYNILPLASEYQVQALEDRCHRALVEIVKTKYLTNTTELFRHIQIAELYNLEELRERCILIASEHSLDKMNEANRCYKVSNKSFGEVKDFAIKRYQLNAADEQFLFSSYGNSKTTLTEAIRQYIQNAGYGSDKENLIRARRLYIRYIPKDAELLKYVEDHKKLNQHSDSKRMKYASTPHTQKAQFRVTFESNPTISEKEQLKLLPERMKQLLQL